MKNKLFYIGLSFLIFVTSSCLSDHKIRLNDEVSVQASDDLPENPLLLHPITSSIQPKDSAMSTLYANDVAFDYASEHSDAHYPIGSELYEVTWKQQPDEQWFGANIPKKILQVERVSIGSDNASVYTLYSGRPLKSVNTDNHSDRIVHIVSQRMAMVP